MPLLEAMSCGLPVVASAASSIPEVVGDAGVLLDPDDEAGWTGAIERILDRRCARAFDEGEWAGPRIGVFVGAYRARDRRGLSKAAGRVSSPISVIVLNYNGRDWLGPCLTALSMQSGAPQFEIVLGDNGSTDGSMDS